MTAAVQHFQLDQSGNRLSRADAMARCVISETRNEDEYRAKAEKIAAMFEAALGKDGVEAPGHEPYPDPSLFSASGIIENLESPDRRLFIAELDGEVVGGIIADKLHEYACEFNCMAVDKRYRGLGIGSLIVEGAMRLMDNCFFVSNITEMVTHSLASQCAHIKHGYNRFLGFGYSHYPHVFFPDRPESVLWAGQLQGRLARWLKNPNLPLDDCSPAELALAQELRKPRLVYVPHAYVNLATEILAQYADVLNFEVVEEVDYRIGELLADGFNIDFKPDYAHTYIDFEFGFDIDKNRQAVKEAIDKVKSVAAKRFIRATIKANHPTGPAIARFLQEEGFVFHSLLPLYRYEKLEGDAHKFYDLLGMQWIRKDVAEHNPLPGETNSVIKVYGYPANLTGKIINQIWRDMQ